MEVGAIKQAYNNEVIHLKKKVNQAKIQLIHKLTRKAKTLTQKKCAESLKEKLNKKAKSAVEEVLILKKITHKELAKFAVTHKGQLNEYLNKPTVDKDKACARLLLHKCLEDKYNFFRSRFTGIPIGDLVMSREERRKIKKEEKEKQKNKKKAKEERKKNKSISSEGDWSVADVESTNLKDNKNNQLSNDESQNECKSEYDDNLSIKGDDDGETESDNDINNSSNHIESDDNPSFKGDDDGETESDNDINNSSNHIEDDSFSDGANNESDVENRESENDKSALSDIENDNQKIIMGNKCENPTVANPEAVEKIKTEIEKSESKLINKKQPKEDNRKKLPKKVKDSSKVKKLSDKILSKKLKKDVVLKPSLTQVKIVDPFFITSSGDNYMSLAEPKGPDVLDDKRRGNRQMRRAQMFGHELKFKPRQRDNDFSNRNGNGYERSNKFEKKGGFRGDRKKFDKRNGFQRDSKFNNAELRQSQSGFNKNRNQNSDKHNFERPHLKTHQVNAVPEKLHPSWEAKKKKSGILPFEGKKIVFE